jgi:hypothetical protein
VKAKEALLLLQSAFTEDLAGRSRVRERHFAYWREPFSTSRKMYKSSEFYELVIQIL